MQRTQWMGAKNCLNFKILAAPVADNAKNSAQDLSSHNTAFCFKIITHY
jgi:hypothetical protein